MNSDQAFGDWLRQRRRALDLTQEELARQVGCSGITLRKLESESRKPSKQIAERLAEVLQVPANDRPAFLRFARGDPFAAPGVPQAPEQTHAPPVRRHNLPLQLTSFIGRETEMAEVRQLLAQARLVTLTGAGGSGKTRLALEVAGGLVDEFADGVWLVELAPLADPALVPQKVSSVLGLREVPGQAILDALLDHLRARHLMFVLDNCEHLIGACAELVETLLQSCPRLTILATSRETLNILGEITCLVPTLPSPDRSNMMTVDALAAFDAVRLFVDRAQAAQPGFKLTSRNVSGIARVCQQLDGIPLAIELAAARVKVLGVAEIAAHLADRFQLLTDGSRTALPRHQTLRALIDWSYDLLSEPERGLLRRLAVFAGSWTLEAAQAVGRGDGESGTAVFDGLSQLVRKSLVSASGWRADQTRYHMLETIRQYAQAKLEASGEGDVVRRQHAVYYLGVATSYTYEGHFVWLDQMETEQDNLRAAVAWSQTAHDDVGLSLQLVKWLGQLWMTRAKWSEGRLLSERVLALPGAEDYPELQGDVLEVLGNCVGQQGDYAAGQVYFSESLRIFEKIGNRKRSAELLDGLGWVAREQGDAKMARAYLEKCLALAREMGHQLQVGTTLNTLAGVAIMQEDAAGAMTLLDEALTTNREAGHLINTGWSLNHLGHVAQLQARFEQARQFHQESLPLLERMGPHSLGAAWANHGLGETALALFERAPAHKHLCLALESFRESGDQSGASWCLSGLAGVAALDEEPERAARLWGAAEALRVSIGARPAPAARATRERLMAAAREQLGEEAFAAAWAEGEKLTMEHAVALALIDN